MKRLNLQKTPARLMAALSLTLLLLALPAFGQADDRVTVARNFLLFLGSDKQIVSTEILAANELAPLEPKVEIGLLARLSGGGYLFVSASTRISPIKAYSLSGDFDALPPAYRRYLMLEAEARIRNESSPERLPLESSETQKRWDFLLQFDPAARLPLEYVEGSVLMTARWNQSAPYNKFLPEIDGQKVLAGCVNVAMAQIMSYHAHPAAGSGAATHLWNGTELAASFSRPYHWTNMPAIVAPTEPEYRIDEVALLLRDLGIMNRTTFGLNDSATSANFTAFAEHFGYSWDIRSMDNSDGNFLTTLQGEIDNLRPVILELPGHMVVADGYLSDGTGDKIHLNMGWGGADDDYYSLDAPIVAGGYTFDPDLTIRYNILPCSAGSCAMNLEAGDTSTATQITGLFDYATDADRYQLYLKGATTLSGSRGYSNQAFYLSLYDSDRRLIKSDDTPLSLTLPDAGGLYTLRVSLQDEAGGFYTFDEYTSYTVDIVTSPLSDTEKAALTAASDNPPAIESTLPDRVLDAAAGPFRILIAARDYEGDTVTLSATSTNPAAVTVGVENENILVLTPAAGAANTAARIIVTAAANGATAEKSFIAMVTAGETGFGKSFTLAGEFATQEDLNLHPAILDGYCEITGYNGYTSQAFFTSVQNEEGTVTIVPAGDTAIKHTFAKGRYRIAASLMENPGGSGMLFDIATTKTIYQISVSCPEADDSPETIAALLGIDLSQTIALASGDLNSDGRADLTDALIALRVLARSDAAGLRDDYPSSGADVNNDARIGLQEVVYLLEKTAGLR